MKSFWRIFILSVAGTLLLVDSVYPAKILVIDFLSTKSHKLTYLPLVEELGKRGHQITMVSPVKPGKEMKNVKEIFTVDMETYSKNLYQDVFNQKEKGKNLNPMKFFSLVLDLCNVSLDLPQVRNLLSQKFDLVFIQPFFTDCALGLAYRLGAPFVLFTPTVAPSMLVRKLGGHLPPSIIPSMVLGYPRDMSFSQRFINFGVEVFGGALYTLYYEPQIDEIIREKLGNDIPPMGELIKNASLILSNGHFSLAGPRPNFPDVVDVGGIHSRPPKPIPKDLEDFILKGKDGFILFSMGSAIKSNMMPENKRKLILNVFSRLKQQVLWKWESETMPDLPKNVKLSKWLPQQDLLGRKDIKMFITHCGGGSTEEAIYHGVPLLAMPMFGDQPQNAKFAKEKGFVVELDWRTLTEETFEEGIKEVLHNPKYRESVTKLSALFKDRPQDPLELAVYWIEYVIRFNGAPHLRTVGRKLNGLVYHSVDVIAAYTLLITILLWIIWSMLKFVGRKACCRSTSKDKKIKQN